jgi:hypothetical protein
MCYALAAYFKSYYETNGETIIHHHTTSIIHPPSSIIHHRSSIFSPSYHTAKSHLARVMPQQPQHAAGPVEMAGMGAAGGGEESGAGAGAWSRRQGRGSRHGVVRAVREQRGRGSAGGAARGAVRAAMRPRPELTIHLVQPCWWPGQSSTLRSTGPAPRQGSPHRGWAGLEQGRGGSW